MPHWNKLDHNAGFSQEEQDYINNLPPLSESDADCVYRICSPMHPPSPLARKTLTFCVTELGYDQKSLHNPAQNLNEVTTGENLIITPSRWARDRLLDFGFNEGKIRVVRHGVNTETFTPLSEEERIGQRLTLGLSPSNIVFLNVGVPTWNKGIDLLIRAFANVFRRNPEIRLILKDARGLYGFPVDTVLQTVGAQNPGLITPEVLSAIRVIPNNLSQAELRSLYGFVDYYVSPYRAEGFNLPVLEAQSCATPVIVTSGGATDDFCHGDGTRKIPSTFIRGNLGKTHGCAWNEPDYPALERILTAAAQTLPSPEQRQSARNNALKHTWDSAVADLYPFI